MKRGDVITLEYIDRIWIERTPDEVQALRDRDREQGRHHDDAGEPIIYGPHGSWDLVPTDITCLRVTVTSMRPVWIGLGSRPRALRLGHSEELGRDILFQRV